MMTLVVCVLAVVTVGFLFGFAAERATKLGDRLYWRKVRRNTVTLRGR
jgi:hypothetical protein